jgi:methionine synthase I (cobalamin-dependent)/5,10-methylenetetrahydrofolate reductase
MLMKPFAEELARRVLVCDGAMGTMLYAKGIFLNRSFDELNLTQPDLVAEVHLAYVRAGADVIETNTFGANRVKLTPFGLGDRVKTINVQGARIARHAAREQAYVAGSIGPLGIRIEPWGKTGVDEAEAYFREQVAGLIEGGVDLFVLETFHDLNEIAAAIRAVRGLSDLPIIAQVTTEEDGNTLDGMAPEAFVPQLEALGANVIGVNCSVGPAGMLETIERMARVAHGPLSAQPNAGRPREIEGRNIYLSSPEYMASYARRFVNNGVRLVGGCCGTTPEHIRHIKTAVRALNGSAARPAGTPSAKGQARVSAVALAEPVARVERSRLANALARGSFTVTVELVPPRGHQTDALVEQARQLHIHGVDFVNIPDGPRASARMSALAAALVVQQQAGIETILHYACRDRNLLGMQSDLLGAHSMGVRNLLIVTGDPPRVGDYPDATAVFDVDSIGLTNVVARLNRGLDIGEQSIGQPTAFHIGVAVNPGAPDVTDEVRRFRYKVEAGAEFAITQPVFDVAGFADFLTRIADARIPILAGVMPLESLRHAEYMANEVPGVKVPDVVVERMRRAEESGRAAEEGLAIAREVVSEIRPLVQGIQISTAAGAAASALQLMEAVSA